MEITKSLAESILNESYALLDEADTPEKKHTAINRLCDALSIMEPTMSELIIDQVKDKYNISKTVIRQTLKSIGNGFNKELQFIKEATKDEIQEFGFYEENNKYVFLTKDGVVDGSNFIITPLFHIYSKSDNKRLIKITNEFGYESIIDVPSSKFTSFDQFQQIVYGEGNYLFFGNRHQFLKILSKISDRYPICNELKTMGWQREGFFAFSNGIFDGDTWQPVDQYGITEHDGKKYFSPAFSEVYSGVREDDDEYENDRFFIYSPSTINFNQWAKLMVKVYTDKAPWAISYLIASLFRDVIYEKFKFFPHLFLFGQPQSGKSALAWSLSNVFFNNLPAFNLNSGTNVGFFRRLARFRNTISWYDEYTNEIDPKRFQALKAAYDGIGHEKGKLTKDNRTEITKINAACVISGQYKPTIDDNALYSRSILLSFPRRDVNNPFTDEETKNLNHIREIEKDGLSSIITEILRHRKKVERDYPIAFSEVYNAVKNFFIERQKQYTERIILNFVSILTIVRVFEDIKSIKLGFKYTDIFAQALHLIENQSNQISESDALSNLWMTIQFLFESNQIIEDTDFKFNTVSKINLYNIGVKFLEEPRELLFIRFSKIHPLYLEAHRRQYGTTGVDFSSLRHYISNHISYLGNIRKIDFQNTITSAYVFDYEILAKSLTGIGFNLKKSDFTQQISDNFHDWQMQNPPISPQPIQTNFIDNIPY